MVQGSIQSSSEFCSAYKLHAVILFNMGGPNSLDDVEKFLFNIFNDKHMIQLWSPFRYLLAKFISKKRLNHAKKIYESIGGKSPILDETNKQAELLESVLGEGYKVFVVMRYSSPFIEDVISAIADYKPDLVTLLPLYPQYCSCTTLSSIESIKKALSSIMEREVRVVCCYYNDETFIEAHSEKILECFNVARQFGHPRILFSAHGIPQYIIDKGDPYAFQVSETVRNILMKLDIPKEDYNWNLCYQSKVGRLKWLEPSTEHLIKQFADEVLIVVPIAFTSEHSETLVELDIEYKMLSKNKYFRVPSLSTSAKFIECLRKLCLNGGGNKNGCTKRCYIKVCVNSNSC